MVRSMTAYGRSIFQSNTKDITVELKSVNNRFLDISVRLPRFYSPLENLIKKEIQNFGISRGKIDVSISVVLKEGAGTKVTLDKIYADSYIQALKDLRDRYNLPDDISVMRVASNRDLFLPQTEDEDTDRDWIELKPVLTDALIQFNAVREAEGERLKEDILQKKENIKNIAHKVNDLSKKDIDEYQNKLETKLRQVLKKYEVEADEQRILTECAIFADKVAVDEELVRLESHFVAFDDILTQDIPVGRNLDFLIQEMNREINTTGSKCSDSEIAHMVVDMKTELEKIREQVQNIE